MAFPKLSYMLSILATALLYLKCEMFYIFTRFVQMCIVEVYLVFLNFLLNLKEDKEWQGEYYSGISGGNNRGKY